MDTIWGRIQRLVFSVFFFCSGALLMAGDDALPRSSPEAQGVSSKQVLEFVQAADTQVQSKIGRAHV